MADESQTEKSSSSVPDWMNPNKVPPWAYLLMMLGGGGGLTGLNSMMGADMATTEDIERIEAKVDTLSGLVTDLRIAIASHHAKKP